MRPERALPRARAHPAGGLGRLLDWLSASQRAMPMRHRGLLAALALTLASPFSAPVAAVAIAVVAAVRSLRAWAGGAGSLRPFASRTAAAARESRLLVPGAVLWISATVGAAVHGNATALALALGLLGPVCIAALWFERTWTRDDALHFSHYASLLILPVAVAGVVQAAFFPVPKHAPRVLGTLSNPNILAIALEMLLPWAMAMLYHVWSRAGRTMLAVALVAGWALLYATGSRSGLLAAFVGVAAFLLAMSERRALTVLLGLAALLLVGLAVAHEAVLEALKPLIPRLQTFTLEMRNRAALWGMAWDEIAKQPVLGRGLFSFPLYVTKAAYRGAPHCHSLYLSLWLETGLPGLLAFLWLVGRLAASAIRSLEGSPLRPYLAGGLALLASLLVHGVTDMPIENPQTLVLFAPTLAALSVALGPRRARHDAAPARVV